MKSLQLLLLTLALAFFASSAYPATCGFLFIKFECKKERDKPVAMHDASGENVRDPSYAATSLNEFRFTRASQNRDLGYSIVTYSFLDKQSNRYAEIARDTGRDDIISGSISDWIRKIFFTTDKIYLVSIELYADENEKELIAFRNLIAVTEQESMFDENVIDAAKLEGYLGFFRKSDSTYRVAVTIRSAERSEIAWSNLREIVELANNLAGFFSDSTPISSLVDETQIASAKVMQHDLERLLSEHFPREQTITRSVPLESREGKITGFVYDFRASGFSYPSRVQLSVQLESIDSLLLRGGKALFNDILAQKIHVTDDTSMELDKYLASQYTGIIEDVSAENIDAARICIDLDRALGDRFIAKDIAVARNAFMTRYREKFESQWSDSCLLASERAFLEQEGIELISPDNAPTPVADAVVTGSTQINLLNIIGTSLFAKYSEASWKGIATGFEISVGHKNEVRIVDRIGISDAPQDIAIKVSMEDFSKILQKIKISGWPGCFNGETYENNENKNIMSAIVPYNDGKFFELIVEFDPAPVNPAKPAIVSAEIRETTPAILAEYIKQSPDRKKNGCNAGDFNPFSS